MFTMFTYLYTIVYMTDKKSVYSFRFSDKVLDVLQEQDNPRQFVEDLILGHKKMEVVPLSQLKALLDEYLKESQENIPLGVPQKKNIASAARSKGDILNDIKALEAEKMEITSQDPDDYIGINKNIADLWKEYHAQDSN